LLGIKDELSGDVELIFIPTSGDEILVDNSTIEYFLHAYAITKAGFIISNHFKIISGEHRILQKLKSGDDPSNIIISGRQNSPMLFCHGSIIAISREYINENVINPDVNFGYDYALRMGVLGEKGSISTINIPTYSFKRGKPFYPGAGLQEKFKTNAAMIIRTYKTASPDPETGELILDDQTIIHDEFLVHYNNPLLQFCIPGPGAPRYYRKEALEEVGGFPDLLYGEDSVLSDKIIKEGYIIKRNLSSPKYIAVRHGANTDAQSISLDLLIEKNRAKYLARASIMEEIKHIIGSIKEVSGTINKTNGNQR